MRFRIRTLLLLVALASAWIVMADQGRRGTTPEGIAAFAMFAGLAVWGIYRTVQESNRNTQLRKDAREGDGDNLTG